MNNLIDKQAAITMILGQPPEPHYPNWYAEQIKSLPPAQFAQQWILCSEKMPEEHEWIGTKTFGTTISNEVYVTFEAPNGERFAEHISFQNGKLSPMDEKYMKAWYNGAKPIAWMPLPEPYEKKIKEKKL